VGPLGEPLKEDCRNSEGRQDAYNRKQLDKIMMESSTKNQEREDGKEEPEKNKKSLMPIFLTCKSITIFVAN
jgi:hypothetical protein